MNISCDKYQIFVVRIMKRSKQIVIGLFFCIGLSHHSFSQKTDTAKHKIDNTLHIYFIITAGDEIKAFYNDKPVEASTVEEFNTYVQSNVKSLVNSWVIVTGKPKTGTFDEVMKTLKHNRFKHISTNIKE